MHHIAVEEAARRRGVGSALFRAVEACALAERLPQMAMDTWAVNRTAQAFFEALGFVAFNISLRKNLGQVEAAELSRAETVSVAENVQ